MQRNERRGRPHRLLMVLLALAVLLPSLYGFGTKFLEFVELYRGDVDGAFAITPIANYLLASLGFLCLFGWAVFHGMFRDIERPKITMLENEAMLDRAEQGTNPLPGALAWNRSHPSGLAQGRRVNPRNRHDRG